MDWSAKVPSDIAAKRAGGRRRYNSARHSQRIERRLLVSEMLFDQTIEGVTKRRGLFPRGIQKAIAGRLGVNEGTVSRDIKAMMRAHLFPGLPAAKQMILAEGDRDAIVRAVCAVLKRPDLPAKQFLYAARIVVEMDIVNVMANQWPPEVIRARECDICRRAYRLMLATLSYAEKWEDFREELSKSDPARDVESAEGN